MSKKTAVTILVTILLVMFVAPQSFAKVYTWRDKNGKVWRTYYPPPAEYATTQQKNTVRKTRKTRKTTANQVELYVTSWCPYCKKAKAFFRSQGISAKIYDVEKDRQAAARKKQLDSQGGVPFAVVNGVKIHGYSADRYKAALAK